MHGCLVESARGSAYGVLLVRNGMRQISRAWLETSDQPGGCLRFGEQEVIAKSIPYLVNGKEK